MKTPIALVLGLVGALCVACAGGPAPEPVAAPAPVPVATGLSADELHARGEAAGIHNFAEVTPGLFRGAQPEGDASFALLASMGVKTILTVDGSQPDVAAAAKHGIRYVHIPIEYSGVTRAEQVKIAKAALEIPAPMFVHCHHGKHRGPAASGIAWMSRTGCSPAEAIADMKRAGADPKYVGLYADVGAFVPVTAAERAALDDSDIGPSAKVADLVGSMIKIDMTFDRMKAVKKAGWKAPASMPDVQPSHEARILAEHFREAGRLEQVGRKPADFQGWREDAEKASWDLEKAIESGDGVAAGALVDRIGTTCNACHDVYRNTRKN